MKRPSMLRAVKAKCRNCMAGYADGRRDCEIPSCSLYWWMPYRKKDPDLAWTSNPSSRNAAPLDSTELEDDGGTSGTNVQS